MGFSGCGLLMKLLSRCLDVYRIQSGLWTAWCRNKGQIILYSLHVKLLHHFIFNIYDNALNITVRKDILHV